MNIQKMFWISNEYQTQIFFLFDIRLTFISELYTWFRPVLNIKWISNSCFEYRMNIKRKFFSVRYSFDIHFRALHVDARPVLNIKWISNSCFEYRMNIKQLFWISNEYQTLIFFCSIFVWHSFPSFTVDARPVLNIKWISNRCFEYRMNIKRKFFSVRYSFDIHFRALQLMLGLFWISNEYPTAVLNIEWISNAAPPPLHTHSPRNWKCQRK